MPIHKFRNYEINFNGGFPIAVDRVYISGDKEIFIYVGDTYQLEYFVTPNNATYDELEWVSSDESICEVDEYGIVTGISDGVANVTIKIQGRKDTCKVHVIEIIHFVDQYAKEIMVRNFDRDGDGEISITEAQFVTSIPFPMFVGSYVQTFDELAYFTNLKTIGMHAFDSSTYLEHITFPDSLKNINKNAFSYCSSLNNIIIPESVNKIDSGAFSNCDSLSDVYMLSDIPPQAGYKIFDTCPSLDRIHVSEESEDLYLDTIGWGIDENHEILYYTYISTKLGFDYTFDFMLS